MLAGPAAHRWASRDVNQLIGDWVGVGHWLPTPHKPIGLLGAILAWHGHDNLDDRPAAADMAREAEQLAADRARIADQLAARDEHAAARTAAQVPWAVRDTPQRATPRPPPRAARPNAAHTPRPPKPPDSTRSTRDARSQSWGPPHATSIRGHLSNRIIRWATG